MFRGLILACAFLVGCSEETPKLYGKPPVQAKNIAVAFEKEDLNPAVDILFIVDDSGSMSSHQSNLSRNVNLFLQEFQNNKDIDYQIGVITTDNTDRNKSGKLQGRPSFITRQTPNGLTLLRQRLIVGTNGSGTEQVFDPVYDALNPPLVGGVNAGFYRPKAYFAMIIITDAEEQSYQFAPASFYSFLLGLKANDPRKFSVYSAYIPVRDTGCHREEDRPERLEEFFEISKAQVFSLCDRDYGKKLADVGKDLVKRVNRRVLLQTRPVVSTMKVIYGTQVIPPSEVDGWIYNVEDNSLNFGPELKWTAQPEGTTVSITYVPIEE